MASAWVEGADIYITVICIISQRRYFGIRNHALCSQLSSVKYSDYSGDCHETSLSKTPSGHLELSHRKIFLFPRLWHKCILLLTCGRLRRNDKVPVCSIPD